MLAKNYRFVAENQTGDSVTVTIKHTPYLPGGDGSTSKNQYQSEVTDINAAAVTDTNKELGAANDNSTAGNYGAHVDVTVVGGATASGDVYIYMEGTGSTFEDTNNVQHTPIGTLTIGNSETKVLQGIPV